MKCLDNKIRDIITEKDEVAEGEWLKMHLVFVGIQKIVDLRKK